MKNGYYRMARGWMNHPIFGRERFTRVMAWRSSRGPPELREAAV